MLLQHCIYRIPSIPHQSPIFDPAIFAIQRLREGRIWRTISNVRLANTALAMYVPGHVREDVGNNCAASVALRLVKKGIPIVWDVINGPSAYDTQLECHSISAFEDLTCWKPDWIIPGVRDSRSWLPYYIRQSFVHILKRFSKSKAF